MQSLRLFQDIKELLQIDLENKNITQIQFDVAMGRLFTNYPQFKPKTDE